MNRYQSIAAAVAFDGGRNVITVAIDGGQNATTDVAFDGGRYVTVTFDGGRFAMHRRFRG